MAARLAAIALIVGLAAPGCGRTWRGETAQPGLALDGDQFNRTSRVTEIVVRDKDLGNATFLVNSAFFVAVTKDRLRFHIRLVHKWRDYVEPGGWTFYLEDDAGNRYEPETVERGRIWRAATADVAWDDARHRYVYRIGALAAGLLRVPLLSQHRLEPIWLANSDVSFYQRNIFATKRGKLTLVMKRRTKTYRYEWRFVDPEDFET